MMSQRTLLELILGLALTGVASAQTPGAAQFKSSSSAIGLQAGQTDFRLNVHAGRGLDNRAAPASYGVGLSWDFSPRASATVGWDTYDVRSAAGDREVRSTSLGLQWRY